MRPLSKTDPVIVSSHPDDSAPAAVQDGSYRMIQLLGRGTMASVYLAEQLSMARLVALKILSPALASDPAFIDRFLREARASARLNHPNIVGAIDFGEIDNRFFLAMEYIDGESLAACLAREGSLEEKRVLAIGRQVLSALDHASQHNVIHLDVKPANIMICKDGRVKLTDFGLAMVMDAPGGAEASRKSGGTPYYMAPEQVEGGKLDWRADQFSLGASLYEAVTGQKPFQGKSVRDILVKRFFERPAPAWKAGGKKVGRGFSAVLAKMLARSPDARYQSFRDLEKDFDRLIAGKKPAVAKSDVLTGGKAQDAQTADGLWMVGAIERVNAASRKRYWNLLLHSSFLFLAFLGVYALINLKELRGPNPPEYVRVDALSLLASLPEDRYATVRANWVRALKSLMLIDRAPTVDGLKRALFSFKFIRDGKEFQDTVYVKSSARVAEYLEKELSAIDQGRPAEHRRDDSGAR